MYTSDKLLLFFYHSSVATLLVVQSCMQPMGCGLDTLDLDHVLDVEIQIILDGCLYIWTYITEKSSLIVW